MAGEEQAAVGKPVLGLMSMVGLTLVVGPLSTMAHEIGGHAWACLALNGRLTELGAYYVQCASSNDVARRVVSMAGTGVDLVLLAALFLAWRVAKGDTLRLALWYAFMAKGMTAFGYWCFSGLLGIGDWGPGEGGGIGPLPNESIVRAVLLAAGAIGYVGIVVLGRRTLAAMIGGGPDAYPVQRRIAVGYYIVNGVLAIVVGLLNPHGFFVTLASAAASTLGGSAGMFSIGYARTRSPTKAFRVVASPLQLVAGIVVAVGFAAVLGPTVRF